MYPNFFLRYDHYHYLHQPIISMNAFFKIVFCNFYCILNIGNQYLNIMFSYTFFQPKCTDPMICDMIFRVHCGAYSNGFMLRIGMS